MIEVAPLDASKVSVDVCRLCQFVWFDLREMDGLKPLPVKERVETLPERARELIAMARADQIAREEESKFATERWRSIVMALYYFGFPRL